MENRKDWIIPGHVITRDITRIEFIRNFKAWMNIKRLEKDLTEIKEKTEKILGY